MRVISYYRAKIKAVVDWSLECHAEETGESSGGHSEFVLRQRSHFAGNFRYIPHEQERVKAENLDELTWLLCKLGREDKPTEQDHRSPQCRPG